jgi:hypothetical protein
MIRRARLPIRSFTGVVISGGAVPGRVDNYVTIPKRDLVGATMVVVQRGRLHIAKGMPETNILVKELRAFRALITTHNSEKYENDWRVAPHDDLVLALALALHHDKEQKSLNANHFFLG